MPKYSSVLIFLYYWFVYVCDGTTSLARTGIFFQNKLHMSKLLIIMLIGMFKIKLPLNSLNPPLLTLPSEKLPLPHNAIPPPKSNFSNYSLQIFFQNFLLSPILEGERGGRAYHGCRYVFLAKFCFSRNKTSFWES